MAPRRPRYADRRRQNRLVNAGWTVLRFTWQDTLHPDYIPHTVRQAIAAAAASVDHEVTGKSDHQLGRQPHDQRGRWVGTVGSRACGFFWWVVAGGSTRLRSGLVADPVFPR